MSGCHWPELIPQRSPHAEDRVVTDFYFVRELRVGPAVKRIVGFEPRTEPEVASGALLSIVAADCREASEPGGRRSADVATPWFGGADCEASCAPVEDRQIRASLSDRRSRTFVPGGRADEPHKGATARMRSWFGGGRRGCPTDGARPDLRPSPSMGDGPLGEPAEVFGRSGANGVDPLNI